ncbi:hypothetical protein P7C70_g5686, partial [Phenoliferia sp. Uapishka_3]
PQSHPTAAPTPSEPVGPTATAIYDYEAAEEGELTFVEGGLITEIEMVSEDWWQGTAADGSVGVFPANYVELNE